MTAPNREQDRQAMVEWAQRVLDLPPGVIIFDTETGALKGEVIELAMCDLDGECLFNHQFHNQEPLDPEAVNVHGIDERKLLHALPFSAYAERVTGLLTTAPLVLCYNAAYDTARLAYTYGLHGLRSPEYNFDCVMLAYAQYAGQWNDYHGNYKWQKLPTGEHHAHTALGDVRATADLIKRMAKGE